MNILYTFLNFNGFTGSELYYYELAREMVLFGHKVTIASNCSGEIKSRAVSAGIKCINFSEVNDFGEYNIIHASHKPVLEGLMKNQSLPPLVATIHSEILEIENPGNALKNISHFIAIRPTIYNSLPLNKRTLIYNPIDFSRFNNEGTTDKKYIFFPGSLNELRINPIMDLASIYSRDYEIVTMGRNDHPNFKADWLTHYKEIFNIEDFIKASTFVAGIIKGRTYMEAVLCGKVYLDYRVDRKGNIMDISYNSPGEYLSFDKYHVHRSEFDSRLVARKIELIYRLLL